MPVLCDTVTLEEVIATAVQVVGCQLWGCEWVLSNKQKLLRVYVEGATGSNGSDDLNCKTDALDASQFIKDSAVTVDDCARVHRQLQAILKVEARHMRALQLEVSSPGLERRLFKLSQYRRYVNHTLRLLLCVPYQERKRFIGILEMVRDKEREIVLQIEGMAHTFAFEHIVKAYLVID